MVRSHDIYWMSFVDTMIKSRGEDWNPINWFNPVTFLVPCQARIWIYNVICGDLFYVH